MMFTLGFVCGVVSTIVGGWYGFKAMARAEERNWMAVQRR